MKTILYNPIFINPQAYYVFPRLTRWLRPDDSYKEPANYIGQIEVTIIAYGEIGYTEYFEHTNYIDFTNFSNSYVRISLFTRLGSCVLGEWKIGTMEGDRPYIEPEVLASLKAVVIVGDKTNQDKDRDIVANLVDASNPFIISNAAFKLNSGFGEYKEDFTSWRIYPNIKVTDNVITTNGNFNSTWFIYKHADGNEINEMNIKVSGIPEGGIIRYFYIPDETATMPVSYNISEDGVYHLPKSKLSSNRVSIGFTVSSSYDWNNIRIEQIPSFEGAFVTDGVNDLITSTKTVQEMGITDEVTVVSMIHQIDKPSNFITTNNIRTSGSVVGRNAISLTDKTGIYGWYKDNIQGSTINVINNILGDKADYTASASSNTNLSSKFSVVGYISNDSIVETSQVAWYWTIIANKVLTTDQINQVIAYFNLDRTLKPDILCNTIKQGITNENHAEFGDRLIDFSGNGRDIQLNNIAWKGDSGIGKYEVDFLDSSIWTSSNSTITSSKIDCKNAISHIMLLYYSVGSKEYPDIPSFKVIKTGADIDYSYIDETGSPKSVKIVDGVNILPASHNTLYSGSGRFCGFGNPGMGNSVTITQIPSHAGALCLGGVNDFGKVTGMPVYKDYTVVTDREIFANIGAILSKNNPGAFVETAGNSVYSFGQATSGLNFISTRSISYLSKYSYCGQSITAGAAEDGTDMWLGTIRDNDSRFFNGAIYSLMSFPYSMSEFLIERQLKKHKLGTLYPDMVEFRPIIKANDNYKIFYTAMLPLTGDIWERINIGDYVPVGRRIAIQMSFDNEAKKLVSAVSSQLGNITIVKNSNNIGYTIFGDVLKDKSPQKITMTIEQDENYVLFNPVITSNVEYHKLDFYLNNYQKRINIGDYIPKGAYLRANFYLKNNVDELTVFTFNGVNIGYRRSSVDDTAFNIGYIYNYDSPQEVNITIDEYIRYEDIVQPYPSFVKLENLDRTHTYTWGDKLKVGDIIRYNSSKNLLEGAYTLRGQMECNGVYVFDNNQQIVVTKEMVFAWSHSPIWNIDDNEPKCILSPRLLRIPNSSYKILGHIPDISGHGNHGKINNSAYAGMSGVNGYPVVFGANKTWANESDGYVTSITSNTIHITNVLNVGLALLYSYVKYNGNLQNIKEIPPFKIEIKGLEGRSKFIYKYLATSDATKETNLYLGNGTHELPKSFLPTEALINNAVVGFSISPIEEGVTNFLSDITIKVLPEYEGAYCLDGVDDSVNIPTTVGGKQVLMKVNWDDVIANAIIYDQRGYPDEFAIYNADKDNSNNPVFAYQARNTGQTYIDGILNSNIKASELKAITHNITITNELSAGVNKSSPVIGSNRLHDDFFANMALYDFMLFDNISTDDKIKELNEYVGIEGNTEWRKTK